MRQASPKGFAPMGMAMNSCRSTELSACAPPFKMFIIGTGSVLPEGSLEYRERYLYRGCPAADAAARAAAMETARMALAPRLPLLGEPSVSIMRRSSAPWLE